MNFRIGEVAKLTGLTPRTLRYWEEQGLISPSSYRGRGERLYSSIDMARVTRIKDLQELLGFSLAEVRVVLDTEDIEMLDRLRSEYRWGDASPERRRELLDDAIEANREAAGTPGHHPGPHRPVPGRAGGQVHPPAGGPGPSSTPPPPVATPA